MSRKVGLSDTYFDPDIDGDVDFDFFGGACAEEERDPKTADQPQKPVPGPQFNDKSIEKYEALNENESNDHNVASNTFESKSDELLTDAEGANSCSDDSVIARVASSGGDGISMKPWVMRPEAEKLLQQKSVSQLGDDDYPQVSHDDAFSTSAHTQVERDASMISPSCQTECESVSDKVEEMSNTSTTDDQSAVFDMKLLSKAITDLRMQDKQYQRSLSGQGRSTARSERSLPVSRPRKNMTFNNEEVRRIDLENKILLKKIIQAQNPSRKCQKRQMTIPPTVIASSAINRMREFKKIESENLQFLKRLQAVKPTKSLRSNERSKANFIRNDNAKTRMNSSICSSSWIGTGSASIDSANLTSRASSSTSSIKLPNIKNR